MSKLKNISIVLKIVLLGLCCLFSSRVYAANTIPMGDVSGNGTVSLYDASLIARYLAGLGNLTTSQLSRADVNGDGKVDMQDANLIAQEVMGEIQPFSSNYTYTFTTTQGLSGTITPTGIQTLSLNGQNLLMTNSTSNWTEFNASSLVSQCGDLVNGSTVNCVNPGVTTPGWAYNSPNPNEVYLDSTKITQSIVQTAANIFVVTHTYPNATFTYTYTITGEDITISTAVQNNSANDSFYNLGFGGLDFNFASPLGNQVLTWSNMQEWHYSYVQAYGRSLFHPDYFNPIGAWYIRNNYWGVAINSLGSYNNPNMVWDSSYKADPSSSPERHPTYLVEQSIGPGQSATVALDIRISNNVDINHLLAPYQQDYNKQYPSTLYQTDARPIVYTCETDSSWISPDEPYGFQVSREWDKASISQQYLAGTGVYIQSLGAQGVIDWSPQGWKAIMYTPAIDEFPSVVATNLNTILIPGYHNLGLNWGVGSRPGNDIINGPATTSTDMINVDPTDPSQLSHLWGRFNTTIQMGARIFYEDSFPMSYNDIRTLRYLRNQMNSTGYNVQTYSEYNNDLSLPYGGAYTEMSLTNGSSGNFYLSWLDGQNEDLALLEWLVPGMGIVSRLSDTAAQYVTGEQGWAWAYAHKVSALPFDWDPNPQAQTASLTALNAQYIDPVTHTWKASAFPTPAVPENVTASKASSTQINLTWTEDPSDAANQVDLISFVIQRSLDGGNTWQNLVTLMKNQTNFTTSYSDTNLSAGQTYTYRMLAISDFNGYSSYSNPASVSL